MDEIRLPPTHSLFSVSQTPLIQVPRPRAEARGYPWMCPPWGTPLVSPWRIFRTPERPFVSTISGRLYSPCVPLLCVSLLPSVWTLAAAPFQRTGCPYKISGRTTFGHFGQIFRLFLEFGAHERRWRFLYSKTWQLYKVELSFPERYTQFFDEFSTVLFKMIFLDTKPKGVPFTKIRFSSNFSFWDGLGRKMRFWNEFTMNCTMFWWRVNRA